MVAVSTLESKIDDLYRQPLDEFVAARSALASELKGAEAQRVKALKKPTIVPWAVNQVYWHARPIFDRVQRSGADLRRAQIAALEGRAADVHAAADAPSQGDRLRGRARRDAGRGRPHEPEPRRGRPDVRGAVARVRSARSRRGASRIRCNRAGSSCSPASSRSRPARRHAHQGRALRPPCPAAAECRSRDWLGTVFRPSRKRVGRPSKPPHRTRRAARKARRRGARRRRPRARA